MPGTWVGRLSRYRLRPDRWTRGENARRSDEERSPGSPRKREMSRPAAEHRADGVPVRLRADVGTTAELQGVVAAQAAPPRDSAGRDRDRATDDPGPLGGWSGRTGP